MIHLPAVPARRVRRWPWRLAVLFIVATLIALVIVPWTVNRRVERMRLVMLAAEPARTMVMRWHYHLTREVVALSEIVMTGDSESMGDYTAAYADEQSIHLTLEPIVGRLGDDVVKRYVQARTLAQQWHGRIDEERLEREVATAGASLMRIPHERRLIEDVSTAIAHVDEAVVRVSERTRVRISSAGRDGMRLSLLLGVLMLVACGAVITLEHRMRRFAEEAEARRAEADSALAESARVTEARQRLLRGITHDVKNPLGAAKGYAELLEMGVKAPLAPEQQPLVEGVARSIDNALAIIEDLLDYSRAEGGEMTLERTECDLNDLVEDAARDHDVAARAHGHTIEIQAADEPLRAHTDPMRVRQVLDNLLSNAIKFTPTPGHIAMRVRRSHEDGAKPRTWAIIEVSDTGPGIPREKREAVFEEFTRLNKSEEGHGLGLAIARGLSRRLGGDLTIADTEVGATFVLRIPQRDDEGNGKGGGSMKQAAQHHSGSHRPG